MHMCVSHIYILYRYYIYIYIQTHTHAGTHAHLSATSCRRKWESARKGLILGKSSALSKIVTLPHTTVVYIRTWRKGCFAKSFLFKKHNTHTLTLTHTGEVMPAPPSQDPAPNSACSSACGKVSEGGEGEGADNFVVLPRILTPHRCQVLVPKGSKRSKLGTHPQQQQQQQQLQ